MSTPFLFDFIVDKQNNNITIKREFAANRTTVWDCYTKSEILDQWWVPLPWKSETKSMDFRVGGQWHYAAVSPEGEKHWSITTYKKIEVLIMFFAHNTFVDENGMVIEQLPQSTWSMNFSEMGENTLVHGIMQFDDLAQLEQNIALGFKEGLTMAMENLDALLAKGNSNS